MKNELNLPIVEQTVRAEGIRISILGEPDIQNSTLVEAGHAFVYFLKNELHKEPEAHLVDLFVEDAYRRKGIARKLLRAVVDVARREGAYKIVPTSRASRTVVHELYRSEGFVDWGIEFRMDLVPKDPDPNA